jgi:hypothetical protein
MPGRILQLNFIFSITPAEYEEAVIPLADAIAAVPGLRWKVWLINELTNEAGGIYLFESEAAANAYVEGPIVAGVLKHPGLSHFSVKQFDVLESTTSVTRGPVKQTAEA